MGSVRVSFDDFLGMLSAASKPAYESRDRRIFDYLRTVSTTYHHTEQGMSLAALLEAVSKALTSSPPDPSGLAQMIAYEREGGVSALLSRYYRTETAIEALLPAMQVHSNNHVSPLKIPYNA
jgi:hypothetical protein